MRQVVVALALEVEEWSWSSGRPAMLSLSITDTTVPEDSILPVVVDRYVQVADSASVVGGVCLFLYMHCPIVI
jgi:hypothetical protein